MSSPGTGMRPNDLQQGLAPLRAERAAATFTSTLQGGDDVNHPAAWHPDPLGRYEYRYWDGARWTEHVANQGVAGVDATGLEAPGGQQQAWGAGQPQQQASGWQQPQQPAAWQQPASPTPQPQPQPEAWSPPQQAEPQPAPSEEAVSAPAAAASPAAAVGDDLDHWQQPWTAAPSQLAPPAVSPLTEPTPTVEPATEEAAVTADSEEATAASTPAVEPEVQEPEAPTEPATPTDEPADQPAAVMVEPAEEPSSVAGDEPAGEHWQQPWTSEPAAAPEEPPAPQAADPESTDEARTVTAPLATPTSDLPHWQQPWTSV
jgi:hypothetical protein